jgi:hypothetical protein
MRRARDGFCLIYYEGRPIGEVKGVDQATLIVGRLWEKYPDAEGIYRATYPTSRRQFAGEDQIARLMAKLTPPRHLAAAPSAGNGQPARNGAMRTQFKIWLQHSRIVPPPGIWKGIAIVEERWFAADGVLILVEGDGSDVEALVNQRKDVFSICERNPADFEA